MMNKQIRQIQNMDEDELYAYAKVSLCFIAFVFWTAFIMLSW